MAKNYFEPRVDGDSIRYEKVTANGHEFEIFLQFLGGASEWYAGLVGALPKHLESEHKKPRLLARGPSETECRKAAQAFLEATFPAWPAEKRSAWEKKLADEAEAARAGDAAKKKKAAEAKKAAS